MAAPAQPRYRLAVCQFAPRFGEPAANAERIARYRASVDAELLLTPELSLTGYDLRDRAAELAVHSGEVGQCLGTGAAAVVGFVEAGDDGISYNSAAVMVGAEPVFVHRKLYLPTYGMFDEGRYFGRGGRTSTFELEGWRFGLLICEDFWHPALVYLLACQRIDVLLVLAAAPGRGVWEGGEYGPFASTDVWVRIARVTAQLHGIYVALCNRVGVEGGVTFAGESLVVAPDGEIVVRAGSTEETLLADLSRQEILRARTPYAHLRDEQTLLVRHELERLTRAAS